MEHLSLYQNQTANLDTYQIVAWALHTFGVKRLVFASSFSAEDQIVTSFGVTCNQQCRFFTIDTGRHFQDTYSIWQKSMNYWNISYEIAFPDSKELSLLIEKQGPDLFYKAGDLRKACCEVRKTNPLKKTLSSADAWIVGLRSEQSVTRSGLSPVEWDDTNKVYRISPLYNWSESDTFSYIQKQQLPLSLLYERGFRSIGCEPCTRAIGPTDDIRSGRWWWEEPHHKECGLHNRQRTT